MARPPSVPPRALALLCATAATALADPRPALLAGTSMVRVDEDAFGARTSLAGAFAVEVSLPVRGTRWAIVPSLNLGVRLGTQPMIGTLAEMFAIARTTGSVSVRLGTGPMQMIVEDSGRARFVERGVAACAAVHYHPRANIAVVVSAGQGWLGEVTVTTATIGAVWTP